MIKYMKYIVAMGLIVTLCNVMSCKTITPAVEPVVSNIINIVTNILPSGGINVITNYIPVVTPTNTPPVVAPTNTPPVVVPTNVPPTPVFSNGIVRCSMFIPQKQPRQPWITTPNSWPDSTQAYARSHGNNWENDFRHWCVSALQAWDANAIVFFADRLKGAIELEMFLCDTASPVDQHHISDAENSAVWLKNVGVTTHIIILTDSPDWGIPGGNMDKYIADLSAAYATPRGIKHIWLIGLECNRLGLTSVAGCASIAANIRKYEPNARIVVGSASQDFLKSIHATDGSLELWKEQDGHPINQALTASTAPAYIAELNELGNLVGASKVWAGEWYANDDATRRSITQQIMSKGYNCGSGQFNNISVSIFTKMIRFFHF
jgi:hypothetical protein